jgi:toxin ParE1/3/4
MVNFQLSKRAERDLENIAIYTIQNFGFRQARIYRDGLFKTFEMIREFPMIGSDQSHIKQYVRRQVYESHAIYYRTDTKTIFILRILGPGENPVRHIK